MSLTDSQLIAIRNDITSSNDSAVIAARGNGADIGRDDTTLAAIYNAEASPAFVAWRSLVTKGEIQSNGFAWAQIDNVAESRWRIWTELFDNDARAINPSKPNVRAGLQEVWSGTAQKAAVNDYILTKCKRNANRVERLLTAGGGTTGTPALLVYEGSVSPSDIGRAFQL